MPTARYDFELDQGTDVSVPFSLVDASDKPVDLTGCKARMQLRTTYSAETPADDLSTENGRMLIDGPAGTITAKFTHDGTAKLKPGAYVYDVEVETEAGEVLRVVSGEILCTPEVTR